MENWKTLEYDAGIKQANSIVLITADFIGSKPIRKFESSCSCIKYEFKDNKLYVNWKLSNTKEVYVSYKYIDVIYKDGTKETLTFKCQVNEN